MLDPALRTVLEERLAADPHARTVASPPTERLQASAISKPWSRSQLPLISLNLGAADAANENAAGQAAPDLEVMGVLGEGGMGKVRLAVQHSLGRDVAIKTTHEDATSSEATALVREARITGTLQHPGIVPVHALGLDLGGAPVLVMKRIEGVAWNHLIAKSEHPAWASRPGDRLLAHLEILMQVCRTVHFAHTRGVLHLDIKPANVMVGDFGEVYLVDWGIAQRFDPASAAGIPHQGLAGTPAYMAPEMVVGDDIGVCTDVFLLGASLHSALIGKSRNKGTTVADVLASALDACPYDYGPEVPAELAHICNRATAREPSERFASAEALRLAIAEYLQHRSSIAVAEQAIERSRALAALLSSTTAERPSPDLLGAYRLASEARFGFEHALREWSGNQLARDSRSECLALVVELELRQGHIEAAELVLREMDAVPAALRERVSLARSERERQSVEHVRLRAIARELDPNVAEKQRGIAIALFSVTTTAAAAFAVFEGKDAQGSTQFAVSLGLLVSALVVTVAMRRKLLENAFNRQTTTLFLLAPAGVTLNRLMALAAHSSISTMFRLDILVLLVVFAATAATLVRELWIMSGLLLVSLVATLALPDRTAMIFAIDIALLPIALLYGFRHHTGKAS